MVPETLLHYRILQPLGSGGMGDVYLAEDSKLGRRVALKVLPLGPSADPERRQRFEREARTIAALNHPNIVTIHAVEQDGDITFLTMELVEGRTLSALLPKSGMPINELLKIAIPLADAVAAAHERSITHRDLKPSNVMLTPDGRVKVLDFGLAKLNEKTGFGDASVTNLAADLTGEGRIVGTVAYMSPEQAEGKPVDHRTDIFSLGVVLYELATGERPFSGDTNMSTLSAILKDTPRSVSDIRPDLPRDLARIIKRALVKDPEHRYQTAKDLRNDLETFRDELTSGALDSPAARSARPRAPRRRLVVTGALIGLALVLGSAAVTYMSIGNSVSSSNTEPSPASARPFDRVRLSRLTSTGRVSWSALSADGRYVAHVVIDGGKQSLWLRQVATTSNVQIVPPAEVRYDGVGFSPDGNFINYVAYPGAQSFASAFQVPVLGGTPRRILDDVDTPISFSPDGRQFAFVRGYMSRGETAIVAVNADGTNEQPVAVRKLPLAFMLNNLSWSPDGSTIATIVRTDLQNRARVVAVDVKTGRESEVGRVWAYIDSIAWMPDGRGLIVAAQEDVPGAATQIWHLSYPSGDARKITNDLNNYGQISVGVDGRSLTAVQSEGAAHLWVGSIENVAAAKQITTGTGHNDGMRGLSWTPDGRIVYTSSAGGNPDLWMIDPSGGTPRQLTVDAADDFAPVATADGRSVVFISNRPGGSIWQMDPDGGNQRPLVTTPGMGSPIVSADSKWLYYTSFSDRTTWRMPLAGGSPERLAAKWAELGVTQDDVFYHPTMHVFGLTPDGTHALGYYSDPQKRGWRVALLPLAGGTPRRFDVVTTAAVVTPDGRHLLYLDLLDGIPKLARQPITGGPVTVLATFPAASSFTFALSRDGRQLALSRGTATSDVVLIAQER